MPECIVALGSNLNDPAHQVTRALQLLEKHDGLELVNQSKLYETDPIGGPADQNHYVNAACIIVTELTPRQLLTVLQQIENQLGRVRDLHWGPRIIDLDLIFYGDQRVELSELIVPHPHMNYRRFVLEPIAEIAPNYEHPDGWSVSSRLDQINQVPLYIAITGPMGVGKTTLAKSLASQLNGHYVAEFFDGDTLRPLYEGDMSHALAVQNQFLESRCELLSERQLKSQRRQWIISDFWYGQSLAYSGFLLNAHDLKRHRAAVDAKHNSVLEPTLIVWLDVNEVLLAERIRQRGRDFEESVDKELLTHLRNGYRSVLESWPGSVYRPRSSSPDALLAEMLIVAQAIEKP